MTALYSCRSINAVEYRISKFDADFNLLSSYTMTREGCDCPQGHKPTCRHRKMLPEFAKQGHIDDGYFYDWDTRQWRKPIVVAIRDDNDAATKIASSLERESAIIPVEGRS